MAERYSSFDSRGSMWFIQRLTAAFLIVVLAFHFMIVHFVNRAAEIIFMGTQARMSQIGYFATMVLFLLTATVHGVNGVYNALINQGLTGTPKTVVKYILITASVLLIVQGIRTALAMTGMELPLA
jgi:succinate dehydrogenase / fumarate reductase membrane anchor subunit